MLLVECLMIFQNVTDEGQKTADTDLTSTIAPTRLEMPAFAADEDPTVQEFASTERN